MRVMLHRAVALRTGCFAPAASHRVSLEKVQGKHDSPARTCVGVLPSSAVHGGHACGLRVGDLASGWHQSKRLAHLRIMLVSRKE